MSSDDDSDYDSDSSDDSKQQQKTQNQVKKVEQRLGKEIEKLKAQLRDRELYIKQLELCKAKAEEYDVMLESLKTVNEEKTNLRKEVEKQEDLILDFRRRIKDLLLELDEAKQESEEQKKDIEKIKKEMDWERIFREGQQKKNDKLIMECKQFEHDLNLSREFNTMAETKWKEEEKEVLRQRSYRLVDVHKYQLEIDKRKAVETEAETAIQKAIKAAEAERDALRKLRPLNKTIAQNKITIEQNSLRLMEQASEIEILETEKVKLETKLTEKTDELLTWRNKHTQLQHAFGKLQKIASQLAQTSSEKSKLTSKHYNSKSSKSVKAFLGPGEVLYEDNHRYSSPTYQSLIKSISAIEENHSNHCPAYSERHGQLKLSEPLTADDANFKTLLESAAQQLCTNTGLPPVTVEAKRQKKNKPKAKAKIRKQKEYAKGSMYLGYGLGLKKAKEKSKTEESIMSGSASQILIKVNALRKKKEEEEAERKRILFEKQLEDEEKEDLREGT